MWDFGGLSFIGKNFSRNISVSYASSRFINYFKFINHANIDAIAYRCRQRRWVTNWRKYIDGRMYRLLLKSDCQLQCIPNAVPWNPEVLWSGHIPFKYKNDNLLLLQISHKIIFILMFLDKKCHFHCKFALEEKSISGHAIRQLISW
jgi:hypothetical protein